MLHSTEQMTCRVKTAANGFWQWRQLGVVVRRYFCFMPVILLLSACSTTVFDQRACPVERTYTKAQQQALADAFPKTPLVIRDAMVDYGKLRDKARACRGVR